MTLGQKLKKARLDRGLTQAQVVGDRITRNMLSQIFTDFKPELIPQVISGYAPVMALMAIGYLLHLLPAKSELWAQQTVTKSPLPVKAIVLALLIWGVMLIKSSEIQPFIYFQF